MPVPESWTTISPVRPSYASSVPDTALRARKYPTSPRLIARDPLGQYRTSPSTRVGLEVGALTEIGIHNTSWEQHTLGQYRASHSAHVKKKRQRKML
eukprot:302473-Rhodomonas_salina.1